MTTIYIIGGGKGGVGKSTISMGMVDTLTERGERVLLVESDDSNPDVYKALYALIPCEICNMDDESGYIRFGDVIEANPTTCIVVNTAARATSALAKYGGIIVDVAKELKRDLVMLWPINRQRDSLELLNQFVASAKGYTAIYAILNTYFGDVDKFVRYHASNIKSKLTGCIEYPELNDLVADKMVDKRLALCNAADELHIAERSALRHYRDAIHRALGVVCHD